MLATAATGTAAARAGCGAVTSTDSDTGTQYGRTNGGRESAAERFGDRRVDDADSEAECR
jgi:hypothetical protein